MFDVSKVHIHMMMPEAGCNEKARKGRAGQCLEEDRHKVVRWEMSVLVSQPS